MHTYGARLGKSLSLSDENKFDTILRDHRENYYKTLKIVMEENAKKHACELILDKSMSFEVKNDLLSYFLQDKYD